MTIKRYIFFSFILCLSSCINSESKYFNKAGDNPNGAALSDQDSVNRSSTLVLYQIIDAIPPPLEIMGMINSTGASYSRELLSNPDNLYKYNSNYLKSINLGIYAADIGYISIYNNTQDAITYLSAIQELAEELSIGHFFNFRTMSELAAKRDNLDSLLHLSTLGFENMNEYLKQQNRGKVSMLILLGSWIEGLYLSTTLYQENPSDALKERIGEQKIMLDNVNLLFEYYQKDEELVNLARDFRRLKEIYDEIEIIYKQAKPVMQEKDGVYTIHTSTTTEVDISEEQIVSIHSLGNEIRNNLIN